MRKKLFSRNNLVKISAISLTCALVFIPVSSHINSLSTVHADNSVSISSVDTSDSNEQTSDNDEQSDKKLLTLTTVQIIQFQTQQAIRQTVSSRFQAKILHSLRKQP